MEKLFFVLFTISLFSGEGWAASLDEEYKLKQLCENDAQEIFSRETRRMKLDHYKLSYINHYNKSLKTCFMIIQISTDLNLLDLPVIETLSYDFFDVEENAKVGSFFMQLDRKSGKKTLFFCHFSGQECHSLPEWQKLIKLYMEE